MNIYKDIILNKTLIKPKNVLEIGSRDGDDAEKLREYFDIEPFNVWVVEPNPTQQIKINQKYQNFNLIKNPIFNVEKTLIFYGVDVGDQILNGVSSLYDRVDNLYEKINTHKLSVDCILGSTLLNIIKSNVDLCKIDVEGVTYEVLESFGDKIQNINSFHLECEHRIVWKNQKLYQDVSNFLVEKKFKQLYFSYCNNDTLQSDSIWVKAEMVNE